MIRTTRPLPNNLYAMLGFSEVILIHVNEVGNVAVLWFERHSSGVGLSIERFGRFNGNSQTNSHWVDGSFCWTHVKHVENFDAKSLSDDDAWKMVTDLFGYDACMEVVG
ncbi:hypothetical protein [Enterobacter hormaechei]